jgi:hypothetical protein
MGRLLLVWLLGRMRSIAGADGPHRTPEASSGDLKVS